MKQDDGVLLFQTLLPILHLSFCLVCIVLIDIVRTYLDGLAVAIKQGPRSGNKAMCHELRLQHLGLLFADILLKELWSYGL